MPAQRTGGRRVKIHQLAYKAPSPRCERTLCGVGLGNVSFTMDPPRVTCGRCKALLKRHAAEYRND